MRFRFVRALCAAMTVGLCGGTLHAQCNISPSFASGFISVQSTPTANCALRRMSGNQGNLFVLEITPRSGSVTNFVIHGPLDKRLAILVREPTFSVGIAPINIIIRDPLGGPGLGALEEVFWDQSMPGLMAEERVPINLSDVHVANWIGKINTSTQGSYVSIASII